MFKRCVHCGIEKPLTEFHKDSHTLDGLQSWCKNCKKNYPRRKEDPQRSKERHLAWRCANPDKVKGQERRNREKNREQRRISTRFYAKNNLDKVRVKNNRRYARKLGAFGVDYTTQEMIDARIEYYGGLCWICGAPMEAIDHVKPLAKGGAHLPCNFRPICKHCNSVKKDKWPLMMPGYRP